MVRKGRSIRSRSTNAIILLTIALTFTTSIFGAGGGFDNTLDGNGRLATDFNDNIDLVTDLVIQSDGKIVAVGITASELPYGDVAVARYNVDGSLDTTFSGDGKLVLTGGNCQNAAVAMSGTRIVIGYCAMVTSAAASVFVTKLNSDGTLDDGFSDDGHWSELTLQNFIFGDIAVDSSGRITVVGGSAAQIQGSTPASDWLLWRLTSSGTLDSGFSGDGRQVTDFGGNLNEYAVAVHVLSNGSMLAAGSGNPAGQGYAVAKYTTNGSLDTNWGGGDGKVFTDIVTTSSNDLPADMKVDQEGRIIIGGTSTPPAGSQSGTVVRYTADGTLDTSFAGDGIYQDIGFGQRIRAIAIQWDGKIIGVGGESDFTFGRLNVNGTPDTTFGINGFVASDMNTGSDDEGQAVVIGRDRRILIGGSTLNNIAGATRNFCLARYLPTNIPYKAPFDFDGDGRSDHGIFRPSNSSWWITQSRFNNTTVWGFGSATDKLAPADFTGDGKYDAAIFRPSSGQWFILRSENFSFYAFPFGTNGDVPVPGDYDADGEADPAVFRPSTGVWYISQSSGAPTQIVQFGIPGDQPVVADYDEDGRSDIAIFRPGPREWWIARSTAGTLALQFGATGDKPVQGDYTGDGKADIAIFRPSNGEWYIVRSDDFSFYGFPFGTTNDVPAPADYDGDGRMDPTVVRNTTWFIAYSSGQPQIFGFGAAGDKPIPNAFVPQ